MTPIRRFIVKDQDNEEVYSFDGDRFYFPDHPSISTGELEGYRQDHPDDPNYPNREFWTSRDWQKETHIEIEHVEGV